MALLFDLQGVTISSGDNMGMSFKGTLSVDSNIPNNCSYTIDNVSTDISNFGAGINFGSELIYDSATGNSISGSHTITCDPLTNIDIGFSITKLDAVALRTITVDVLESGTTLTQFTFDLSEEPALVTSAIGAFPSFLNTDLLVGQTIEASGFSLGLNTGILQGGATKDLGYSVFTTVVSTVNDQSIIDNDDSNFGYVRAITEPFQMSIDTEIANPLVNGVWNVVYDLRLGQSNPNTFQTLEHQFTVTGAIDAPATFTVEPFKVISAWSVGETIFTFSDIDGAIVNAEVIVGTVAPYFSFNTTTGELTVLDLSGMPSPSVFNYIIKTTDSLGGVTQSSVVTTFWVDDTEATYTISPPNIITSFVNGFVVASVVDVDGTGVASASIVSGVLPSGFSFNTTTGDVTVTNDTLLVVGTYPTFNVLTTDSLGGTTDTPISLTLLPVPNSPTQWIKNPTKCLDAYENGDVLAFATDADGIANITVMAANPLPAGLSLNVSTAEVYVSDKNLLVPFSTQVWFETTDDAGDISQAGLLFTINPEGTEAAWIVAFPKTIMEYVLGDILAFPTDNDGGVVSAEILSGAIAGTSIDSQGIIRVSDTNLLVAGDYNLSVKTVDSLGCHTISNIDISLEELSLTCFGTVYKECFSSVRGVILRTGNVPPTDPAGDCCSCEYKVTALAEIGANTSDIKNDFLNVVYETPFQSDSILFELQLFTNAWNTSTIINSNTYGDFLPKGFNPATPNMASATIDWNKVINAFGEGIYRVKTTITSLSVPDYSYTHNHCLLEYNEARADDTVRFDWEMSGVWGDPNGGVLFDFGDPKKNKPIKDSIRVQGFFGKSKTEYEREEVEYQTGQWDRVRDEAINTYEFTSGLIPSSVHNILKCFAFLSDSIKVTDYNTNNPELFVEKGILMDSGYEPSYNVNIKESRVVVSFKDKIQNKTRKFC